MTNLAVIPVRAGSTRLKDKNFVNLLGKPLIYHTLDAVIGSALFDTVAVATDSLVIWKMVGKDYPKVVLYWRTEKIDERAPVVEALLEMLPDIKVHDTFSYFLVTCPFRNSYDIRQGMSILKNSNADFVVSAVKYSEPPQMAMYFDNGKLRFLDKNVFFKNKTNSKYMKRFYHPNGGFYMAKWGSLLKYKNFFKGNCWIHEIPKSRSFDINDSFDLEVAEAYDKRIFRSN